MPEPTTNPTSSAMPPEADNAVPADVPANETHSPEDSAAIIPLVPFVSQQEQPMIEVHAPHESVHTWKDFLIHIATIILGLLIAIGLEQTVEWFHHRDQRLQLEEDLRAEAVSNRQVIARDLKMQELEPWFEQAIAAIDRGTPQQGKLHVTLPPAPCLAGTIGTADYRYFAPSEAVWTTAKESSLVTLLPVEQGRMYARLAHNYYLLGNVRDEVYHGCNAVVAMQDRFAQPMPNASLLNWTLTEQQAERFAQTASDTRMAIKGLCFRLRWSDVYEQGIIKGEDRADVKMMSVNQERFEDPLPPEPNSK